MFNNNHFELSGKNYGLNEQEVEERDKYLENIKKEITEFMSVTNLNISVKNIALILSPGHPENILYCNSNQPTFGMHWIYDTVIPKTRSYILTAVKEKALHGLDTEAVSSRTLRGSPEAIAKKIIRKHVLHKNKIPFHYQGHNNTDDIDELKVMHVELTPTMVLEEIKKEYETKHMRYKLWNNEALGSLADYLFFDNNSEYDYINLPAMLDDINDEPLSKEDLIDEAHSSIHMYYDTDDTEISYPLTSKNGYIFSEYLPLIFADDKVKNKLYDWYLTACHNK